MVIFIVNLCLKTSLMCDRSGRDPGWGPYRLRRRQAASDFPVGMERLEY